ncbi:MAG: hypothetical protein PF542_00150 [Nanoarchaeota archaeon]|jgi:hypothetical protein|nr:hypothetical protein [Nanoarchaeota archaeon]
MKSSFKIILSVLLILLIGNAIAIDFVSQASVEECLNVSRGYSQDLVDNGFNVLRVNDLLEKADLIYLGQVEKQKNSLTELDFSLVEEYCVEVKEVYEAAIRASDDLYVLKTFYDLSYEEGMENQNSLFIVGEIEKEINNERYEKVSDLVESGYVEVSSMVKDYSTLNRFHKNTAFGFVSFFENNWKLLLIIVWGAFILFLIFKKTIKKVSLRRKISTLNLRKYSLEEYFKSVQKKYFDGGEISQRDYLIRSDNYSKMILDIDRKIAILNEDLARLSGDEEKKIIRSKAVHKNRVVPKVERKIAAKNKIIKVRGKGKKKVSKVIRKKKVVDKKRAIKVKK